MKQASQIVRLSDEERTTLRGIFQRGTHSAQEVKRAKVLLELDELSLYQDRPKRKYMRTYEDIARICEVNVSTVSKLAKQYVEEGFDATLKRKVRQTPPITPIIDGETEARILALACGTPPEGYARWTLRLLETKVVELGIMERVSDTTIFRLLKKRLLSLT
jgi:transposase